MTIHVELREEQAARLDRFATGLHKSRSEATAQLIEEGLRHAEFPAIEFRDSAAAAAGREAYIVGSRVAVWQLWMVAEGYGLDPIATAHHLQLDPERVSQALRYGSAFASEVRRALEENRAVTPETLQASLPPGSWVDIR